MYGDGMSALTDSEFGTIDVLYFLYLMCCFVKQLVCLSILYDLFVFFFLAILHIHALHFLAKDSQFKQACTKVELHHLHVLWNLRVNSMHNEPK